MEKQKKQLGSSVPQVVSVEITKTRRYNEHKVCREIIIRCEKDCMDRRIELTGFGEDISVKGESEWECTACKPGRKRRTCKAHRRKCYAVCEEMPSRCLVGSGLVNWQPC